MFLIIGAIILALTTFFLSGYITKTLLLKPTTKYVYWWPNAVELICGYAITALLCFLSLVLLQNVIYGGVISLLLSIYAIFRLNKKEYIFIFPRKLSWAFLVKITFIITLACIYGPLLFGRSAYYQLPDIFDLPKQIAAIISVAHSKQWPVVNPYFPSLPFAYNLLFYFPLGAICKLSKMAGSFMPVFAISVLWTAWVMLGLLELVMQKLGMPKRYKVIGILFATFLGTLSVPFIMTKYPIGFDQGLRADNILVSFIYVPQHIFAVSCLLAAWYVQYSNKKLMNKLSIELVLFISAMLSSLILCPLFLIAFIILMSFQFYEVVIVNRKRDRNTIALLIIQVLLFASIIIPFLLQASEWAGPRENNDTLPSLLHLGLHKEWLYLLACIGYPFIFGIIGLVSWKVKNHFAFLSYILLLLLGLVCILLIGCGDYRVKTTMYFQFLIIPLVALGFFYCWNSLLNKSWELKWVLLLVPIIYCCILNILVIGYYISSSYLSQDKNFTENILKAQALRFNKIIYLVNADQRAAALSGHLVYMDFKARPDRYLPYRDREIVNDTFLFKKKFPKVDVIWLHDYFYNIQNNEHQYNNNLLNGDWKQWSGNAENTKVDLKELKISSLSLTDSGFITKAILSPGLYLITARVEGIITQGNAHLSLLGLRKVLNFPKGQYSSTKKFEDYVLVDKEQTDLTFIFGLGGWSQGAGNIKLVTLQLTQVL